MIRFPSFDDGEQNPAYRPVFFILKEDTRMPKVLIIDDEQSIRTTLREILEYEKYEVKM